MLKIVTLLLSLSLIFSGCSSKDIQSHTPATSAQTIYHDSDESSFGERVLAGTLVAGMAALFLTTAAVVILLLVPKEPVR